MTFIRQHRLAFACLLSALLTGCVSPKTMYGWNDYQPEVYSYFQGKSVDEQIATLEKNLEQFKAQDQAVPPGFHAHLGMLYTQVGKLDLAEQEFMVEKKLFPESTSYMDFLLKKKTGQSMEVKPSVNAAKKPTEKK